MRSRISRRALLVLLVAALAATAARLAAPSEAHPTKPSRTLICGSERWRVKTLQDRPKLYSAKPKTVAWAHGADAAQAGAEGSQQLRAPHLLGRGRRHGRAPGG